MDAESQELVSLNETLQRVIVQLSRISHLEVKVGEIAKLADEFRPQEILQECEKMQINCMQAIKYLTELEKRTERIEQRLETIEDWMRNRERLLQHPKSGHFHGH